MSASKTRSFKVRLDGDTEAYGRYTGVSPYQAASKALSEIIRNKKKQGGGGASKKIQFTLIESTRGSKNKEHRYEGKRVKLDSPVEYKVGDKVIRKEFKNKLRKVKKA